METVDVKAVGKHEIAIEWVGSGTNDMIADSVIALILGVDGSPASVKSSLYSIFSCLQPILCFIPPDIFAFSSCFVDSMSRNLSNLQSPKLETSSGHSHSHFHPHAEPATPPASSPPTKEKTEGEEDDDVFSHPLPSRLDRLIAFLDSYFGHVELIQPSSLPPKTITPPPDESQIVIDVDELPEKAEELLEEAKEEREKEEAEEVKEELEHPRVPVIRVKLDEHIADVTVETLVSFLSRLPRVLH